MLKRFKSLLDIGLGMKKQQKLLALKIAAVLFAPLTCHAESDLSVVAQEQHFEFEVRGTEASGFENWSEYQLVYELLRQSRIRIKSKPDESWIEIAVEADRGQKVVIVGIASTAQESGSWGEIGDWKKAGGFWCNLRECLFKETSP